MNLKKNQLVSLAAIVGMVVIGAGFGCGKGGGETTTTTTTSGTSGTPAAGVEGKITIDGSSTVYPISQAMAEEFMKANDKVDITVNQSGTGGGMKKFVAGEIDICNASRPIEDEEIAKAKEAGIEFIELPVAFDGLSIVVNKENTFAETLTVDELKKMWEPDSKVNNWKDVRAGFPDVPLKLFGTGTDSGTFEYVPDALVEKTKACGTEYSASENDNDLVTGVKGEKGGLGYFGYAYYLENKNDLKIVKVDGGNGGVEPNETTINDGTYSPLSRPLFIYVKKASLQKPEVKAFIDYYLGSEGMKWIKDTGYVALPGKAYELARKHANELSVGTRFKGVQPGIKIEDVLANESK